MSQVHLYGGFANGNQKGSRRRGGKGDQLFGFRSTDDARKDLKKADIEQLEAGIIYGVSGVLLNEGCWENFEVLPLSSDAFVELPDALAAARKLEALDRLMPNIKIDTKSLLEQSKKFKEHLKGLRREVEPPIKEPYKVMYG